MKTGAATAIIGGITTQLLAVMIWFVGWHFFQSDVLKLWVNLILPFGALMLGIAGGWGFYVAGRMAKQPSTSMLRWIAVAIALATAFGIRFLGYWTADYDGEPVHNLIGFIPYLQATLGHARMSFQHSDSLVDVGSLGYILELFEYAAYAAASYGFAAKLPHAVRCERCENYMEETLWGEVRVENQYRFEERYRALPGDPAARLIALEVMEDDGDAPVAGATRLEYRLAECPTCSAAAVAESGKIHTGQYWTPNKALNRVGRFDRAHPAPPEPQPAASAPVTPGVRTFGRRTTI